MISFASLTKSAYEALSQPVTDRIYYISDTGEQFLNGLPYDGEDIRDYLCLTAVAANSAVNFNKSSSSMADLDLEYSTDKRNWTKYTWDSSTGAGATITLANIGDKVFFRGDNQTFSTSTSVYYRFVLTGTVNPSGNIMSLVDRTCESLEIPDNNGRFFYCLFGDNSQAINTITDISGLRLPATKLKTYCYMMMFGYQQSLVNGSIELPAKVMTPNCYKMMFSDCTSLTSAPELPATTLAEGCYDNMFYNCTSLAKVPALPAKTLVNKCYKGIFRNSTAFSELEVGFTGWVSGATESWLDGVTASGVFGCPSALDTSIRDANHIPASWNVTFTDIPEGKVLPSSTSTDEGKVLTVNASGAPSWEEPQGEREIPDYFCITALASNSGVALNKYSTVTGDTSSLVAVLEYSTDGETWTNYTWTGDAGQTITLANVGDKVYFRGNNATFSTSYDNSIYYRFDPVGQSAALAVSGNIMSLLDKTMQSTTVPDYAFLNLLRDSAKWLSCEDLRLPATSLGASCYYNMFRNDTGITAIPKEIARYEEPSQQNRKMYVFGGMFRGCTGLTSVKIDFMPKIQTSSGFGEFYNLFRSCWNLTEITVDFTQWSPMSLYETDNWLYDVPASGVFRCPGTLDTSTRDASHIPAGWNVVFTDVPEGKAYPSTLDDEPCWIENASGLPRPSETFTISSKGGWQGIVEYSYNKTDWTQVIFDGTQADGPVATPAWKTGRVWLRKNGPNWGSKYAIIQGATIYRIGGNLASMNTSYSGSTIQSEFMRLFSSWDPTSGSSTPTYLTSNLHDISELRVPHRPLGENAMTWCFEHHQYYLTETCPMPIAYSQRGSDNTTWATGSWYQSFWGCTYLSLIRLLQDPYMNSTADRNNGFYSIVDNTIYGMVWVEKGAGFIKVNCTDLVPGGHFSAATEGSPVSACIVPRTTSSSLNPTAPYIPQYTVASGVSMTLAIGSSYMQTLSGGQNILYGEVIIDCDANGTVYLDATYFSADSDSVTPGKRNWCVYRILGNKAKLYVVDTQDLPSA